ncbi:hypothetical protein ACFWVU_14490 [Streptomyces sp. NPDC058686]|uniref:hypothetical protein n=1 Tax=Streptomyces sp. NPDC058686 TaxID=3346599 RepID=UPI0036469935
MAIKMTWALIGEHMDEWTGDSYREAVTVLTERIGAAVSASGMSPQTQAHFRETFLAPLRAGVPLEGRAAVNAGRQWNKAAGPLLVALAPMS